MLADATPTCPHPVPHDDAMPSHGDTMERDVAHRLQWATQWLITLVFFTGTGFVAAALWHGLLATAMFSCVFASAWGAQRMLRRAQRLAAWDAALRSDRITTLPPRVFE